MEMNEEYHDPDYPEVPACVKEEIPTLTEDEKVSKIKQIVRREFRKELDAREGEVALIDQRLLKARRYLHQLRCALVLNYYNDQKLQMSINQIEDEVASQSEPRARSEVSSILRDSQRGLHPSVRKLLGKKTADMDEIFRCRSPRNKTRVDYCAMAHAKNVTISADATKSLRPATEEPIKQEEEPHCSTAMPPKKVPRHLDPKVDNVLTLDGVTRNKQKHRYRIIIGNTSKYMPPASRADRSTHKWLLYVRGPPLQPDLARVVTAVTVRLHHSYAPHHVVVIDKPPFQVSRRGWGEFPAMLTLQFALPHRNRPATLTHTIKLDRNYTGLQTLGAETVVDVWLYSTPEMLPFEYKTDQESSIKSDEHTEEIIKDIKAEPLSEISENTEIIENNDEVTETRQTDTDEWLNFFTNDTTEVNVDEMFVKNVKKEQNSEELNQIPTTDGNVVQTSPKDCKSNQIVTNDLKFNQILTKENHNQNEPNDNKIDYIAKDPKISVKIESLDDPMTNGDHEYETNEADFQPNEINYLKRIVKYMDPISRKIYYLEVDRTLDLNKIQEIVINSQGKMKTAKVSPNKINGLRFVRKKKGESLLKPEIKNQLVKKPDINNQIVISNGFDHIKNDHCYLANDWCIQEPKKGVSKDFLNDIQLTMTKLTCPRVTVNSLLKKIPLISQEVKDTDFVKCFPFVVGSHEKYWKLDFAKRRNIEWSRAKLINKMLQEKFKNNPENVWRTKQILVYSRLHGFFPVRPETIENKPEHLEANEWSSWNDLENLRISESNIRELYPKSADLCSMVAFESDNFICKDDSDVDLCDSDEEIDIIGDVKPVKVKSEVTSECDDSLTALPVNNEERLRFLFIERMCSDIGLELRNEDIGNGHSYSAVHCVLLSAMKSFAEELIREGLADQLAFSNDPQLPNVWIGSSSRCGLRMEHVYRGVQRSARLRALCAAGRPAAASAHGAL
ncbi:YEATS domain-containing protein 2 [Bicyclus anynana]|uniref:YEATS domain-containing protein 2 n=1 Tax=Bicyclus anynana TaxID=110368 RepID=A0ABM3LUQ3_BICAN|nr:YEATS domain-containing protein 2 [Bicyclus anynana]